NVNAADTGSGVFLVELFDSVTGNFLNSNTVPNNVPLPQFITQFAGLPDGLYDLVTFDDAGNASPMATVSVCANPQGCSQQACSTNPNSQACQTACANAVPGACQQACQANPTSITCTQHCFNSPTDPICTQQCANNSSLPYCQPACSLQPASPACINLCQNNPSAPGCVTLCALNAAYCQPGGGNNGGPTITPGS